MTKIIAFKVTDEERERIWHEAVKVPGRTVSDYVRPIILGTLPPKPVRKSRAK